MLWQLSATPAFRAPTRTKCGQLAAMSEQGIPPERIFVDKQSGKDFERFAWKSLIENLRPAGDLLYIKSIDRIGRNYDELLRQWRVITKELCVDTVAQVINQRFLIRVCKESLRLVTGCFATLPTCPVRKCSIRSLSHMGRDEISLRCGGYSRLRS